MRLVYRINAWLNTILKPFGLIAWLEMTCEEDEGGVPIPSRARIRDIRIDRRPTNITPPAP